MQPGSSDAVHFELRFQGQIADGPDRSGLPSGELGGRLKLGGVRVMMAGLGDEFRMESMALRNSGAFGTETKGAAMPRGCICARFPSLLRKGSSLLSGFQLPCPPIPNERHFSQMLCRTLRLRGFVAHLSVDLREASQAGARIPNEVQAMSVENQAVTISHASQDAKVARRICEALRAGGVEMWFSRLRCAVLSLEFGVWRFRDPQSAIRDPQ
jgi:hypothetical protein